MGQVLRHPVAVVALFCCLVFVGILTFPSIPLELLPNLRYPRLVVITSLGNASSEEVETLLTLKVEEAVGTVVGLRSMSSVSSEGVSSVLLKFDWGSDMTTAAASVREKLDLLVDTLPKEAKLPIVIRYDPTDAPIVNLALTGSDDLISMRVLARNTLKTKLETVAGVAAIRLSGGLTPEIEVLVDRGRLTAQGLDLGVLSERLESANINFPGGKVRKGTLEIPVRTVGRFNSLDDIGQVSLGIGAQGGSIHVADVAEVKYGHRDQTSLCRVNGKPAVLIGIIKEPGANTLDVSRSVLAKLDDLRKNLPQGMKLDVVENEASFIEEAVGELQMNILWGGLLAFGVLLVFLRSFGNAVFILLSIPVSVISTFVFMFFAGLSFNLMSIGGLTLGVGMLVDGSIVVLECIHRKRREEEEIFEAAVAALREVGPSVVAGTLTTMVVLVPMFFMSGLAQRLFREFAFTLATSLAMSLLTATILLPALFVWTHSRRQKMSGAATGSLILEGRYRAILSTLLGRPLVVFLVCGVIFAASLLGMLRLGFELFPRLDTGRFTITLTFPPDSTLGRMNKTISTIEEWLRESPYVELYVTQAGMESEKSAQQPAIEIGKPNEAEITVSLRRDSRAFSHPDPLIHELRVRSASLEDVKTDFVFRKGPLARVLEGRQTPELFRIQGEDLSVLRELGQKISHSLNEFGALTDVAVDGDVWTDQLRVMVDRYQAAARGVTVDNVARMVRNAIEGTVVGRFIQGDTETDIRVRLKTKEKTTLNDLTQLPLRTNRVVDARRSHGKQATLNPVIHLGEVADVVPDRGPREIIRSERQRSLIVRANATGAAFSRIESDALSTAKSLGLPQGYRVETGAEGREIKASMTSLITGLGLAAMLVYVVLAVQFESLVWPAIVFAAVPMTLLGPSIALNVAGVPVGVLVLVGFVVLVGIVVNNAILIVAQVNTFRSTGRPLEPSILDASSVRLKAILMTTLTTVFGALPACLPTGSAAPLNRSLGLTLVSGLLTSTIFTLICVPVAYSAATRIFPSLDFPVRASTRPER